MGFFTKCFYDPNNTTVTGNSRWHNSKKKKNKKSDKTSENPESVVPADAPTDVSASASVDENNNNSSNNNKKMELLKRIEAMHHRLQEQQEVNKQLKQCVGEKSHQMTSLMERLEDEIQSRTHELSKANSRLALANQSMKQQAAQQLEHFACMSHEIRTPLNCIIGMSSLLLETELDAMQRDSVQMITTSGDLLSTVVDDVLDYSKLESGNLEMDIKRINLQQTFDSVVTAIQLRCDENKRGITVRTFYGISLPKFVETDSKRLQQILYNLLGNAVKFSPDNKKVELHTRIVTSEDDPNKQILRLCVKDYGRGIDKSNFKKIFQPFQQEEKETTTVYGGTGLGLPITSKLVQGLGGTIGVSSEKGKWCEFVVDLPFLGQESVDVEGIADRMADTTVVVVVPFPDYSCPVLKSLQECGISWKMVSGCHKLKAMALSMNQQDKERYYISLVYEGIYSGPCYQVFRQSTNSSLITFGGRNHIKAAHAHIVAPCRVFPSILLPALSEIVANMRTQMKTREQQQQQQQFVDGCDPNGVCPLELPEEIQLGYSSYEWGISRPDEDDEATKKSKSSDLATFYESMQVLIAEDNLVNQKVLCKTLERVGLKKIDIVDNGQKACNATEAKHYDVVFMDMEMPIMGGLEACKIIHARKRGGNKQKQQDDDNPNHHPSDSFVPSIVFVTAHAMESFQAEAKAAGGAGFISKPFNLQRIEGYLKAMYHQEQERLRKQEEEEQKQKEQEQKKEEGACILCDPQEG